MPLDEAEMLRERLASVQVPYSQNYLLKTVDQMINEHNYFKSNTSSHTI